MIYRFNGYSLDTSSFELREGDVPIPLEPQVFNIIVYLIENRERVVGKDELVDAIWEGRAISDGPLNTRINSARRAVGDSGATQSVIKTFTRRGFRFVADIDAGADASSVPEIGISYEGKEKPSIAVLPFVNRSTNPDQDFFADGVTEDLITALSRIRWIAVASSHSSFSYKGQSPDVRTVASQLGVKYLLEGSVRAVGDRVRVSCQLVEGITGKQIWAENYDRIIEDILGLQEEITKIVVAVIEPELGRSERARATAVSTQNLDAWSHYHRGAAHLFDSGRYGKRSELVLAHECFARAIDLDPNFSRAYSGLGHCLFWTVMFDTEAEAARARAEVLAPAKKAVELDPEDSYAYAVLGVAHLVNQDPSTGLIALRRAVELNPSYAYGHFWLGMTSISAGEAEAGLTHVETALRLSKRDPSRGPAMAWMSVGNVILANYDKALEWAQLALNIPMTQFWANVGMTVALVKLKRTDKAKKALEELMRRKPDFSATFLMDHSQLCHPGYQRFLLDALREAGLEG